MCHYVVVDGMLQQIGGTKCMVVENAWWCKIHGGMKCMVVQNAWRYKMHGGKK
jgi:hypothetical protein